MNMRNKIVAAVVCGLLAATGAVLLAGRGAADWEEGDDHKMHFPQLPDPNGWDVNATWPLNILADDWNCTESGPVTDIHFWGSWRHDLVGDIHGFYISIWSNNPGDPQGGIPSFPEALLWETYITDFKAIDAGFGAQAWYEPEPDILYPGDHEMYFQYNIINITDPFWQEYGTIYWLSISADISTPGTFWGWKTSIYTNTYDDAFWGYDDPTGGGITWVRELYIDPPTVSMDLAFVITGTPCCNKDWNYWSGWPNIWLIPGGNVGIGTTNPTTKLDVHGNFRVSSLTIPYLFFVDTSANKIGIGTNNPAYNLDISEGAQATIRLYTSKGDTYTACQTKFFTDNSIGSSVNICNFIAQIQNPTAGNERSYLLYQVMKDGSLTDALLISHQYVQVNNDRVDVDFNVRGTSDDNLFYIEASTNRVGIGTNTPQRILHIKDVMRLEPRTTAPSSPSAGDLYFDSTVSKLMCYDGSTWQSCW